MKLLFPNAAEGVVLLKISSISIIFILLSQTISGALQGLGKVMIPTIALGIGAIVKLTLNLILIRIPEIGIYGAALSSLAFHIVSCILEFVALTKIYTKKEGF